MGEHYRGGLFTGVLALAACSIASAGPAIESRPVSRRTGRTTPPERLKAEPKSDSLSRMLRAGRNRGRV